MKEACYTRQDILFNAKTWCQKHNVRLIGAPFETDSQEVADEIFHGITKASCTVDSDFWVLGSKAIVDNLSQSMDNNGVTGKCNIIRRDSSLLTPALLDMDAPALACCLGNDFIDQPYGQGEATVTESIMPRWMAAGADVVVVC